MKTLYFTFVAFVFLVLHGIEEYVAKLYEIDPLLRQLAAALPFDAHLEFLVYQFILWGLLAGLIYYLNQGRKMRWAIVLLAIVLILETEHVIRAILIRGYYPGLVTAFLLPPMGILLLWSLRKTSK